MAQSALLLQNAPLAIVRGVGDVGSAIIWNLFQGGFAVIAHEDRQPRTIRRKMAFCDAMWEGSAHLAGVDATRIDSVDALIERALKRSDVIAHGGSFDDMMKQITPLVLIDARIQKFASIVALKGLAELTIGIGPSFIAKTHVDVIIESCWGDDLGRIIDQGQATDPVPVPPRLNGIGWERFIRAPQAGRFETELKIGDEVQKGDVVGHINAQPLHAAIDGHLRGLLYSGLSVLQDEKICEIDPRGEKAHFTGLAERPNAIAQGVMKVIKRDLSRDQLPEGFGD